MATIADEIIKAYSDKPQMFDNFERQYNRRGGYMQVETFSVTNLYKWNNNSVVATMRSKFELKPSVCAEVREPVLAESALTDEGRSFLLKNLFKPLVGKREIKVFKRDNDEYLISVREKEEPGYSDDAFDEGSYWDDGCPTYDD